MSKNSSLWDNAMVRDAKAKMSKEDIEQYKKIGEQFYKDMDFQQGNSIDNIINYLQNSNHQIIVADLKGESLKKYSVKNKSWALILGNEAHGISKKSIDSANTIINIDGEKTMESLNVAEAASIIMYHLYQGM